MVAQLLDLVNKLHKNALMLPMLPPIILISCIKTIYTKNPEVLRTRE